MGKMDASAECDANGIGVVRAGDIWKQTVRIVLVVWLQTGNTYARFFPKLNSSERIGRCSVFHDISRFVPSIYLRLLVLLNLEKVVLDFLVELLLLLQFRVDGNKLFLSSL